MATKKLGKPAKARELEISKVLVASTAHLHPLVVSRVNELCTASETAHGWFAWSGSTGEPGEFNELAGVPNAVLERDAWQWMTDENFKHLKTGTLALRELLCFAQKQGCRYVLFDRDAEIIDGFSHWEH